MPKFIIEREIPGAGKLSSEELQGISQTSCGVLMELGPQIQWVQSYVTDDRSTACTSPQTKRLFASMPKWEVFRRTPFRRFTQ